MASEHYNEHGRHALELSARDFVRTDTDLAVNSDPFPAFDSGSSTDLDFDLGYALDSNCDPTIGFDSSPFLSFCSGSGS
ncbi:hypothetical protein EVAR_38517_1 [Eumeta japonica]|uniref:Uncharacterized protein n=1 Tax=Eumeta variegata TaxID=151549 RepID=A0A4C1WEJ3_EUMVA|nr:hypothetical protein EVAR_38517_1 [Eumeta japonica]